MNTTVETFAVNAFIFESNDTDVLLKGTAQQGHMNYATDLVISHSQLNRLINTLQKQNAALSVNDLIVSEKMYDDQILYSASLPEHLNREVLLSELMINQPLRQIRA